MALFLLLCFNQNDSYCNYLEGSTVGESNSSGVSVNLAPTIYNLHNATTTTMTTGLPSTVHADFRILDNFNSTDGNNINSNSAGTQDQNNPPYPSANAIVSRPRLILRNDSPLNPMSSSPASTGGNSGLGDYRSQYSRSSTSRPVILSTTVSSGADTSQFNRHGSRTNTLHGMLNVPE